METVICSLCRASVKEGQRLETHLTHEHGVVFNTDFVARVAMKARLPVININSRMDSRQCEEYLNSPDAPSVQIVTTLDETVPPLANGESTASDKEASSASDVHMSVELEQAEGCNSN